MLDFFTIFSRGGIVLWCFHAADISITSPLNHFVNTVLIENKAQSMIKYDKWVIQYQACNEENLLFVAGYNNVLNLPYVKDLLLCTRRKFIENYGGRVTPRESYDDFTSIFMVELHSLEDTHRNNRKHIDTSSLFTEENKSLTKTATNIQPVITAGVNSIALENATFSVSNEEVTDIVDDGGKQEVSKMLEKSAYNKKLVKSKGSKASNKSVVKKKEARVWDGKYTANDMKTLDYSDGNVTNCAVNQVKPRNHTNSQPKVLKSLGYSLNEASKAASLESQNSVSSNRVFSLFKGLIGSRVVTIESLTPTLQKMKEHLISKNVAYDIAEAICHSVSERLIGVNLSTFGGVSSLLQSAMEEALTKVLTPKKSIDILRAIRDKSNTRPYIIVFCGVNGVGKSTSLAKICHFLLNNGHKVMVAACDTFRAGAVEQLRTHVYRLSSMFASEDTMKPQCKLYEKGYGKDASGVAFEAIKCATDEGYNVVMIDTAGRMQDNQPLMKSLTKLIKVNSPDAVLFVGEALVGNDGVDQLMKFNRAMLEFSDTSDPRLIDGIVLTKFDTIDDKVGAALSMTYATGQPIVFVGVGQTYADLRTLDISSVVSLLLK